MTTALTKPAAQPPAKPSALNLMASRISVEPAKLLKTLQETVFKGANESELMALVVIANEYDLNPFLKEIYAFPAKGGGICPIVSVDGWNKMLLRQPRYNGKKFTFESNEDGTPYSCTAFIYVKDREQPEEVTEYFSECFRNTDNWKNMPRRMLRNRTLCQAARMAFGFAGLSNPDEAADFIDITSSPVPSEAPPKLVAPPADAATPQRELEARIIGYGSNFSEFQKFMVESGFAPDADSMGGFDEIPVDVAKRALRLPEKTVREGLAKLKAA